MLGGLQYRCKLTENLWTNQPTIAVNKKRKGQLVIDCPAYSTVDKRPWTSNTPGAVSNPNATGIKSLFIYEATNENDRHITQNNRNATNAGFFLVCMCLPYNYSIYISSGPWVFFLNRIFMFHFSRLHAFVR